MIFRLLRKKKEEQANIKLLIIRANVCTNMYWGAFINSLIFELRGLGHVTITITYMR